MEITMPVGGKDEVIDIPKENINEIIMPLNKPGLPKAEEKIREAVMNPIGSKRLSEIVKEKFAWSNIVDQYLQMYYHLL